MKPSNSNSKPRVIVAHPGTQHSHFTAIAMQRAGMLEAFVTQFYYAKSRWPFRAVRYLPRRFQKWIDVKLYSRNHPELDERRVMMINTYAELIFITLNRLRLAREFRLEWMHQSVRRFSRRVGYLAVQSADLLIGTDDASRDAFQVARPGGVICVLELSIAHAKTIHRIMAEERELNPEFGAAADVSVIEQEDRVQYVTDETRLSDYVIVNSSFTKQSLVENGIDSQKVYVVPLGVDVDLFCPAPERVPNDKELRVLFVGTVDQRKGIGYLLEAVHQLRPNYNVTLTLCGPLHPGVQKCERYRNDYRALGRIDHVQLPEIYRQADVFVLPSLVEGFGRVIVEAMACGLPVIATPHTCAPDIITDGVDGFVVPIRDVEAIKSRLVYLYENPIERQKMGQMARKTAVEQCKWDRYYENLGNAVQAMWQKQQP